MSKIKNYVWIVLVLGLAALPLVAQRASKSAHASKGAAAVSPNVATKRVSRPPQGLTPAEAAAAIDTNLANTCAETAPTSPKALGHNPQVFTPQRVSSTLNGVWLGKVSGEYDPQLFAPDGFLNVDYYMIVDANRGETLVFQAFGSNRSGAGMQPVPNTPKWSYVWCARGNYQNPSPRQVHEFTKVSNNVEDARSVITNSTGLRLPTGPVVLSNVWQQLVAINFFDDPSHSIAYAGVLFKPFTLGNVTSGLIAANIATRVAAPSATPVASPSATPVASPSATPFASPNPSPVPSPSVKPTPAPVGSLFELRMVGEYRGSGETAAKFAPGEPIHNTEQGRFLGVSVGWGDFLVASFGLGNMMFGPKNDFDILNGPQLFFDKVVIGPLFGGGSVTPVGGGTVSQSEKSSDKQSSKSTKKSRK